MEFQYSYHGNTAVDASGDRTSMSFSPDTRREPTYFSGSLRKGIAFREAISALHDVVVSDLRIKQKDKTAYKQWAAQQEDLLLQQALSRRADLAQKIAQLSKEYAEIMNRRFARFRDFNQARQRYFDYLYRKDRDAWFVLDPVITVHPDEIFFECFSQDEASYGRLGANFDVFDKIGEHRFGTTNIDYSAALYDEFQKIRSYKETWFQVDPSGFDVRTQGEDAYREVKIDLPDSWVRGFLQVSSAACLPATSFTLHPMDVHNFCHVLRRHREQRGPRSMIYKLRPGHPVRVLFEPFGIEIECARSIYEGEKPDEIRIWGRRRLLILERLIPVARSFKVHLLGQGMPSFYVADLGDMNFTLGLSGWTANDWSTAGNFDLMAPRSDVDEFTQRRVFDELKACQFDTPDALARRLALPRAAVLGALSAYTQAGRAIFDLNKGVFRLRELTRDPLPMSRLRFANEREESATRIVDAQGVKVSAQASANGALQLNGTVKVRSHVLNTSLQIDADQRIVSGTCSCNWYMQNKLFKGPCEHMLALRIQHTRWARQVALALPTTTREDATNRRITADVTVREALQSERWIAAHAAWL